MIEYDAQTALIVVDCQNDFADPDGSLFVADADRVVANVNREIVRATASGAPVVYTQDWHPADTPHFEKHGGIWPVHCVADTWGAQLHPRLLVVGPWVRKGVDGSDGYSGFTVRDPVSGETRMTSLHETLDDWGASNIVVVGLALDYCVKETAADGVPLGYRVTLVDDATAAVELKPGDADAARRHLAGLGVTLV